MRKTLKKAALSIAAVLSVCLMCSCNEEPLFSGIIEPIRVDVDSNKTETTDIPCTVIELLTKEYDKTVRSYGYGYFGGKYGYGMLPSSNVKHVVDYYAVVADANGVFCRFQIDELDFKQCAEGDTIVIQRVQEYSKYDKPYEPYFAYNGQKLKNAEWYKEEGETIEEEQSD